MANATENTPQDQPKQGFSLALETITPDLVEEDGVYTGCDQQGTDLGYFGTARVFIYRKHSEQTTVSQTVSPINLNTNSSLCSFFKIHILQAFFVSQKTLVHFLRTRKIGFLTRLMKMKKFFTNTDLKIEPSHQATLSKPPNLEPDVNLNQNLNNDTTLIPNHSILCEENSSCLHSLLKNHCSTTEMCPRFKIGNYRKKLQKGFYVE